MSFVLKRRISLEDVDGDWKDSYLEFKVPTYKEIKDLQGTDKPEEQVEVMIKFLGGLFLGGKAWNGKESVEVNQEDLSDLPILVLSKAFLALAEELTPKEIQS